MAEIVRRLKIHKLLASRPCAHCADELLLGEAGAVCEACDSPHHERCWDLKNGCGQEKCQNAYLPGIGSAVQIINLRPDEKLCPYCKSKIYLHADKCRHCGQIITEDGEYYGEKKIAPAANLSLLFSVIGLLVCVTPPTSLIALALGPVAYKKGIDAKKLIATDPTMRGREMAIAGQTLGLIGFAISLIAIWFESASTMNRLAYDAGYYFIPVMGIFFIITYLRKVRNRS